jgi:hypothetical protein
VPPLEFLTGFILTLQKTLDQLMVFLQHRQSVFGPSIQIEGPKERFRTDDDSTSTI